MKSTVKMHAQWRYQIESDLIRNPAISLEARMAYLLIQSYVGPSCALPFPSLDTLARIMDRHRESVQKYLAELAGHGLLERHHIKQKGKFCTTRYALFETKEAHRRGKKPLRKFPTTEISSTKSNHMKRGGKRSASTPKSAPLPDVAASAPLPKIHPTDPPKSKGIAGVDTGSGHEQPAHREQNQSAGISKTSKPNNQDVRPLPGMETGRGYQ